MVDFPNVARASFFIWLFLIGQGRAQEVDSRRQPQPLSRLTGPITLDGEINEAAWELIEPVPIVLYTPVYLGEQTEDTEIRFGYDDNNLYISGRMYDSDPSGIRANTFIRDTFSGDDYLAVIVDSYNDFETALAFTVNPNGARGDRLIAGDAEYTGSGAPFNSDWNAHWDVATRRTDEGWFVEVRIPFSTLGFQAESDEVVMGLITYRAIARKNERHLWPQISPAYGAFSFAKPSFAQRVTLKGVRPGTPLYLTPYVLGGLRTRPILRSPSAGEEAIWETGESQTREVGIDLKYSPSSNLAIDVTANTDFAQVEADNQQINLTRFSLFFPEKRQFFQERSSTFDFGTGGRDRLFFSRRIGLEAGEIVRIYGGARAVGRLGGLDFGLLSMQTAPHSGHAGENMGVLRMKQQIFNPYSSVGGMITTRIGTRGENNIAYGLDTEIRLFGDEYLTVKWAQTFDEVVEERRVIDAALLRARFERRRDEGVSFYGEYGRVGPDYLPRLGFQARSDFSFYAGELKYQWFAGPKSSLRHITVVTNTSHYYRNQDNTAESRSIKPEVRFQSKSNGILSFGLESSFESVREQFRIAGFSVAPGEYWFHEATASWRLPRTLLARGEIGGSAGTFYNGRRVSGRFRPRVILSKHVEIHPGFEVNRFELPDKALTTQLAQLKIDFALNTNLSLSTLTQYNSTINQTSINARMRYHFREGTDLWVVYNEGMNFERTNGLDPRLPLSAGRTMMIKYSHTFGF